MFYEIRNYHYEPKRMAEYKAWASDLAVPYIREQVDLVGFWVNIDEPPIVNGRALDELGSATVTWIIRWDDMEQRKSVMGKTFGSAAWREIMAHNPGRENYHRQEAKFAENLA